jgi:NADPH2:quinone reductase
MRAAVVTAFGDPDVIAVQEIADARPGPGEIAIGVEHVNVLWVETLIRRGLARGHFDHQPPYIGGNGVAGRVRAIGDGVDAALLGRPVLAHTRGRGADAELAVVAADVAVDVPAGIELEAAAALMHDGVTALALLEATGVADGTRVLVVGASGGLGISLIQLARAAGAHVVATARDERKLERVRELGAAAVIDSDQPGWVADARGAIGGQGADVIFDNVGGEVGGAALGASARGGRFSAHGTPSGSFALIDQAVADAADVRVMGIAGAQLAAADRVRLTRAVLAELAAGHLAPVIGQTFPLERTADAHAAIERRSVFGKTLLRVST